MSWVLVFTILQWGKPIQVFNYYSKQECIEAGQRVADALNVGISWYCYEVGPSGSQEEGK